MRAVRPARSRGACWLPYRVPIRRVRPSCRARRCPRPGRSAVSEGASRSLAIRSLGRPSWLPFGARSRPRGRGRRSGSAPRRRASKQAVFLAISPIRRRAGRRRGGPTTRAERQMARATRGVACLIPSPLHAFLRGRATTHAGCLLNRALCAGGGGPARRGGGSSGRRIVWAAGARVVWAAGVRVVWAPRGAGRLGSPASHARVAVDPSSAAGDA